jgi:hypothetical protein
MHSVKSQVLENSEFSANGYVMIESLRVENFRCFKSLELHKLKRVNVLVGTNASGKTVLLEAVKLGLGAQPPVITFLNQLRGFQPIYFPNPTPEQFRSYFSDLFHDFDDQKTIECSIVDSRKRNASLSIYFDPKHAVTTQTQAGQSIGFQSGVATAANPPATTIIPLAFDRKDLGGQKDSLYATVQNGQVLLQPGAELGIHSGFFSSGYVGNPGENANWYSRLSVEKRGEQILAAVQKHFPFVRSLSTETPIPGISALYADIPTISRKLPLTFVSWGVNRVLTFILAICTFKAGVVLIDEVENGIYHDQLGLLWETMFGLAEQYDTQLFISTHSKECLKAALPTVKKHESSFNLLRTERLNGTCEVTPIEGKLFESALEQGFDVR